MTTDFRPYTLTEIRAGIVPADRSIRVYADGVYDLLHYGHVNQFKQVKEALPGCHLIVGVCSDEDTEEYKGARPVMTLKERARNLSFCKYVDELILAPVFNYDVAYVNALRADIVAHDDAPYPIDGVDIFEPFRKSDRFLPTNRESDISTTELISRIVRNVQSYEGKSGVKEILSAQ